MIAVADCLDAPRPEAEAAPEDALRRRGGGPRTPEGKLASRRNALKHGLRAQVLLPDDLADAVAQRTMQFRDEFAPASPYEEWLVAEMARAACQLDRCAELAILDLDRVVQRALNCWDADRRMAVEDLGAKLSKDPARVARALRGTRQGAEWLIERWEGLGEILDTRGTWDDEQRRLAFDLLGVPHEWRADSAQVPPSEDAPALSRLVRREVARLHDDRAAVLDALDEAERDMAAAGLPLSEDAVTARLRRYESRCRRALYWARAELRRVREGEPAAETSPRSSLSQASADYLARRAEAVLNPDPAEVAAVTEDEPDEVEVETEAPEDAEPTPPAASPTRAPRSRRARRAMEQRARQLARRAARAGT